MQMIYEKYYSYIKNYDRTEGTAFMEKVFNPPVDTVPDQVVISGAFGKSPPKLPQKEMGS
jgi:hypothetical protein